jgi:hypothetical protein
MATSIHDVTNTIRPAELQPAHVMTDSKGTKTQTLSLRLDPKTRFILDFLGRIRGQSITTIIERAIKESADNDPVGDSNKKNWRYYWDPDEGVRTLRIISDGDVFTSFEEDEILSFTKAHSEFFYISESTHNIHTGYCRVLWKKMKEYMEIWQATQTEDYWAAGKAMARDLLQAKIQPPQWPRSGKPATSATAKRGAIDDDIPF